MFLAVELSALIHGDADVGQYTIVELLGFGNINVNAPLSGQATCQLDASQDEAAEPFRKRAHDAARAARMTRLHLTRARSMSRHNGGTELFFLRHSKLLRGADSARMTLDRGF